MSALPRCRVAMPLLPRTLPVEQLQADSNQEKPIDKIDAALLKVLQSDGRASYLALAQEVSLTSSAVLQRVQRLVQGEIILGFHARLNPLKLCLSLVVFVEIVLERSLADIGDEFRAAVRSRPEIVECHLVAGSFDFLLKTRVPDIVAYRELIASTIWNLPGVLQTRSFAVIEEVKSTSALAL